MEKVKIGLWGFGRTGKFVATEFLNDERFSLQWIVRKSNADGHKYASRLLGYEYDQGEIIFLKDVTAEFFKKKQNRCVGGFFRFKRYRNVPSSSK